MKPVIETAGLNLYMDYTKERPDWPPCCYTHTIRAVCNGEVYTNQWTVSDVDKIPDERIKQDLTFGVLRMIAEKIEWKTS